MNWDDLPDVPEGSPLGSLWYVKARHRTNREVKGRTVRFKGPCPIKVELDYYCPPSVCVITEMRNVQMLWTEEECQRYNH